MQKEVKISHLFPKKKKGFYIVFEKASTVTLPASSMNMQHIKRSEVIENIKAHRNPSYIGFQNHYYKLQTSINQCNLCELWATVDP